ncbi:MAG: glycosyltransferase family 9 protein [Desulfomonile tiedjei]|nr:glycosyltransferase family 9 protein [Desulfomonile tiedjei]
MNPDGKRILVIKPSSLGDVVHTLPLVHAIKRNYPSCHIGWVIQNGFRGIIEYDPAVDEVIPISIPSTSDPQASRGAFVRAAAATFRALRQLRGRFKARPYDLVLDLHASFRSGLLGLANPNGFRVGFHDAKELNTRFQNHLIHTDKALPHAVDKNLAFAAYLGCTVCPDDFRVIVNPAARDKVRAFLKEQGVESSDRLVYASPAARWATKFWTVHGWAELADSLIDRKSARVVFAGSPQDSAYIETIVERMKSPAIVAAGKLSLAEAVALIEAADVYVGVDSGPMHISAFVGTPVVALFGPTDPDKVGPYGTGHRVVQVPGLDCLGCRKRSCANRRCLEDLKPQAVFDETVTLLGW